MQQLAYRLDNVREEIDSDHCPACGNELFSSDAQACSWQAWGTFWKILGMSHVELVCGGCGEYLPQFFSSGRK